MSASVAIAADPSDSTGFRNPAALDGLREPSSPSPEWFTRRDLAFLGASAGVTTLAMVHDEWLTDRAVASTGNVAQEEVADFFDAVPTLALASIPALYGWGRWHGHPDLARRTGRAGLSCLAAASVTLGLKQAFGRYRPKESIEDPFQFDPFSGHASFPSGHTTLAFAEAVALDRETTSRWVPWVVYPAASMVGWSRVHDLQHWVSDVVAGAAIGGWVSWKVESLLADRSPKTPDEKPKTPDEKPHLSVSIEPHGGTMELVVTRRF